jgi:hypothetical protein
MRMISLFKCVNSNGIGIRSEGTSIDIDAQVLKNLGLAMTKGELSLPTADASGENISFEYMCHLILNIAILTIIKPFCRRLSKNY